MMDQQNLEATRPVSADPSLALAKALGQWPKKPAGKPNLAAKNPAHSSVEELARELGLKLGDQNKLTIRRIKRGKNYSFVRANGAHIRDARTIRRLHAMAVPPAYIEVRYSPDPTSHLQAVGRDAAIRATRSMPGTRRRDSGAGFSGTGPPVRAISSGDGAANVAECSGNK